MKLNGLIETFRDVPIVHRFARDSGEQVGHTATALATVLPRSHNPFPRDASVKTDILNGHFSANAITMCFSFQSHFGSRLRHS